MITPQTIYDFCKASGLKITRIEYEYPSATLDIEFLAPHGIVKVVRAKPQPSESWLETYRAALRGGRLAENAERAADRVHGSWKK